MPIKFRCHHCRQLLGISQAKAGAVVNCPKCQRAIRVPNRNSDIRPTPEADWDVEDSSLARALDELAGIGQILDSEAAANDADFENAPPDFPPHAHVLERVAVDPLLPAVPMQAAVPGPPRANTLSAAGEPSASSRSVTGAPGNTAPNSHKALQTLAGPQRTVVFVVSATVLAIVFCGGYALGRRQSRAVVAPPDPPTLSAATSTPPQASGATAPATMSGRITYVNEAGENRPDRGARVIVLPMRRIGSARLSVVGFRPADSEADCRIAAAAMQALGGNVASAGGDGEYQMILGGAGEYQILVLSHYKEQSSAGQPSAKLRALLSSYFDRPEQLLGGRGYHEAVLHTKGIGTDLWDHTFGNDT